MAPTYDSPGAALTARGLADPEEVDVTDATCSVPGCAKKVKNRGWCSMHYARWRSGADFYAPGDLRARKGDPQPCAVECCARDAERRGWCNAHYQRWRRTGDAGTRPAGRLGKSYSLRSGYVRVWEPAHPLAKADGYVYEHRKAVYDAGVDVPKGYHVHHIDGDKRNNDLSNLLVASNEDHQAHHNHPGMVRKNQYGTWIVGTGARYGK